MPLRRRVKRTGSGRYLLRLPENERVVLRSLPGQLRDLLGDNDPVVARLFPPAYADDVESDAEYQRLMGGDLRDGRLQTLAVFEETIDANELDESQLTAWMGALNDLRLVLGTRLDVTEDGRPPADDDPDAGLYALYTYLGWLQEQVVEALDPEYR
jgi:hypothetical protein